MTPTSEQNVATARRVVTPHAEALRSERVGHAASDQLLERRLRRADVSHVAHHEREPVAAQVPALELVAVAHGLVHRDARHREALELRDGLPRHRQPLKGDRLFVLHAGPAQISLGEAHVSRDEACDLDRRAAALLDPQKRVLTVGQAVGLVGRNLLDLKVLGRRLEGSPATGHVLREKGERHGITSCRWC